MFFTQVNHTARLFLIVTVLSAYPDEQKDMTYPDSASHEGAQGSDWQVFMDAPAYHFKLAEGYLQNGERSKAASELERGNTFLNYQKDRIELVIRKINNLAKKVSAGKEKNVQEFDSITSNALNILNRKYSMVPVEIEGNPVFENAFKYHFEKAKSKVRENNPSGAASEVRLANSFLKLKVAQMKHIAKTDLDTAAENELNVLASQIESGNVKDFVDMDRIYLKALSVIMGNRP